jgi:hypothetical protein
MTKGITFLLANLCVAALLGVTWELGRLSRWVVPNDRVWGEMANAGYVQEHYVLEAIFPVFPGVVWFEAIVGSVFLIMLYRALFLGQKV